MDDSVNKRPVVLRQRTSSLEADHPTAEGTSKEHVKPDMILSEQPKRDGQKSKKKKKSKSEDKAAIESTKNPQGTTTEASSDKSDVVVPLSTEPLSPSGAAVTPSTPVAVTPPDETKGKPVLNRQESQKHKIDALYGRETEVSLVKDTIRKCLRLQKKLKQTHNNHPADTTFPTTTETNTTKTTTPIKVALETPPAPPTGTMILITGQGGVGKTSLAKTVIKDVVPSEGYFLTAKFDRLQLAVPYDALVNALNEYVNLVCQRGETVIQQVRDAIVEQVGDEGIVVLTRLAPSISRIVGTSSLEYGVKPANSVMGDGIYRQFILVFRKFARAISSAAAPVVLLLDDIHWADSCSLDVITSIVTDQDSDGFLVMATYCDDQLPIETMIAAKLRELKEERNVEICNVHVGSLNEAALAKLISSALGEEVEIAGLCKTVMYHTNGVPALIIEFLWWLEVESLLYYDNVIGMWWCDLDEIDEAVRNRKVENYLEDEIGHLSLEMKRVLSVSAALGSHINVKLLEYILETPVVGILDEAAARGIIVRDDTRGGYVFEYDRAQFVAYNLVAERVREQFHLELGRQLWKQIKPEELDKYTFIILSQMRIGANLITDEEEQKAVATLCLHAGIMAARTSTFRIAWIYLDFGISALSDNCWEDHYDLTLALYNAGSEIAMCTSNYDKMEEIIGLVLSHAKTLPDKTRAYATRMYSLGSRSRNLEAIDVGLIVLNQLSERLPTSHLPLRILFGTRKLRVALSEMSNEQLMKLDQIRSVEKLACLKLLHLIMLNALVTRPQLAAIASIRMVQITLEHGLSVFASVAFSSFAVVVMMVTKDFSAAFRYGDLGIRLLSHYEAKEYLPRVFGSFFGPIYHFRKPLYGALNPLMVAYKLGMQSGDVEGATCNASLYILTASEAGMNLDDVEREWKMIEETMLNHSMLTMHQICLPSMSAIRHLSGASDELFQCKKSLLKDDDCANLKETAIQFFSVGMAGEAMMVAYIFNDYELAERKAAEFTNRKGLRAPILKEVIADFYIGLTAIARARTGNQNRKNLRKARAIIRQYRRLSRSCPQNYLDKLSLLEAELASLAGENEKAFEKFTSSLALAKHSNFKSIVALANERTGRHLAGLGDFDGAKPYFDEACRCFTDWGAHAKMQQLAAEMETIYKEPQSLAV